MTLPRNLRLALHPCETHSHSQFIGQQTLIERTHWQRYQELYAAAINETNADYAPWYIIPADSKTKRNLAIAQIVVEKLESLKLSYPPPNPALSKIKIE